MPHTHVYTHTHPKPVISVRGIVKCILSLSNTRSIQRICEPARTNEKLCSINPSPCKKCSLKSAASLSLPDSICHFTPPQDAISTFFNRKLINLFPFRRRATKNTPKSSSSSPAASKEGDFCFDVEIIRQMMLSNHLLQGKQSSRY